MLKPSMGKNQRAMSIKKPLEKTGNITNQLFTMQTTITTSTTTHTHTRTHTEEQTAVFCNRYNSRMCNPVLPVVNTSRKKSEYIQGMWICDKINYSDKYQAQLCVQISVGQLLLNIEIILVTIIKSS